MQISKQQLQLKCLYIGLWTQPDKLEGFWREMTLAPARLPNYIISFTRKYKFHFIFKVAPHFQSSPTRR